jgi:kynurenine formamidase
VTYLVRDWCGIIIEGPADVVFCMTGWSRYYGRPEYDTPPFLTREAVRWLVDQGISV